MGGITTAYAGNYIYENGDLQFFSHPEGYVSPDGSGGYNYVYQFKDHLGNIRLSYSDSNDDGEITASTEIIEENNYYPFGLKHKGYNNTIVSEHPYKYNGKELNEELGLDWYDFGARNYDASLGRWMNLDPLAELMMTYSPYNYAFDNPIYYSDYFGLSPSGSINENTHQVSYNIPERMTDYYKDDKGRVFYDPLVNKTPFYPKAMSILMRPIYRQQESYGIKEENRVENLLCL